MVTSPSPLERELSLPEKESRYAVPPSTHLTLCLGPISVQVTTHEKELFAAIQKRFETFVATAPISPTVNIQITQKPDPSHVEAFIPPSPRKDIEAMGISVPPPSRSRTLYEPNNAIRVEAPWYDGFFDGQRNAYLTTYTLDHTLRSFEGFLLALMQHLLLKANSFFLHSSGLEYDGKAYLFSGPSGAGKTTVVENSPGHRVLSDELIILQYDENTSQWWAHGTPFFGTWGKPGDPCKLPLHAIHFIQKSPAFQLETISFHERYRRLCGVMCNRYPTPATTEFFLKMADRLVPYCRLLHVVPTPEIWSFLSDAANRERGLTP